MGIESLPSSYKKDGTIHEAFNKVNLTDMKKQPSLTIQKHEHEMVYEEENVGDFRSMKCRHCPMGILVPKEKDV